MRIASIIALGVLVGCLPTTSPASPLVAFQPSALLVSMRPVECRIEAQQRSGLLHLVGTVRSAQPIVASASMVAERSGRAGVSSNAQSGVFRVGAGEEAVVGRIALNASPRDELSAELTVEWDGGRTSCRYP